MQGAHTRLASPKALSSALLYVFHYDSTQLILLTEVSVSMMAK